MKSGEHGYTLAETVTGLLVLGLVLSFAVPTFLELKAKELEQLSKVEAMSLLQERAEKMSVRLPFSGQGKEKRKSRLLPRQSYQLVWRGSFPKPDLYQIEVEVQWRDQSGKQRRMSVKTHRFRPLR
ncbi:hypothetical protein [Lihuaxuella thermophila]|uniref:hypothetical protein n=1 Tax=Lihuaxuella thermophila TaxID=1173111 RepID=UPI001113EB72|nr:hypothetical protein [Lihuaxuella thermophila]